MSGEAVAAVVGIVVWRSRSKTKARIEELEAEVKRLSEAVSEGAVASNERAVASDEGAVASGEPEWVGRAGVSRTSRSESERSALPRSAQSSAQ